MTEAEIGYIAGILDGEGAICVRFRSGTRGTSLRGAGRYLHFRVEIAQKDLRLLEWLQQRIGGRMTRDRPNGVSHLSLAKNDGVRLLTLVRPHLIVKATQADAYLHLAAREYVRGRRISDSEQRERERLVAALSSLRL